MDDSEKYIRDHLLIQFMLDCYCDGTYEIEKVYKDWTWWLKTKEKNDGKNEERSSV